MLARLRPALLALVMAVAFTVAQPSVDGGATPPTVVDAALTAADPQPTAAAPVGTDLWPYPQGCVTAAFSDSVLYRDWSWGTITGGSSPCAGEPARQGQRLALTQYHTRFGRPVAYMGAPWVADAPGTTAHVHTGAIPADLQAVCVSAGIEHREGKMFAKNIACVLPWWMPGRSWTTMFYPIAPDSPLVTTPLTVWPDPDGTGTGCTDCFATAPSPGGFPKPPIGPIAPVCTTHELTSSDAVASVWEQDSFLLRMSGWFKACDPAQHPWLSAIAYDSYGGVLRPDWLNSGSDVTFDRSGIFTDETRAVCIATGLERWRDGTMHGINRMCVSVERQTDGSYTVRPSSNLFSNEVVDTTDPNGDLGGTCLGCM
jgi:hypothetical protein